MSDGAARRLWVSAHRYMGLFVLVFLALAAITGVILCFRGPLDRAINPDLFRLSDPAARVEPFAAVAAFARARPELRIVGFPLRPGAGAALPVSVAPRRPGGVLNFDQAFLGPGGVLIGARQTRPGWDRRHLIEGVYVFHYTLLAGKPGRRFMGAIAATWLASNLVGLYLTFPKARPFLREWLRGFAIRPTRTLPRLLLDLHRASGLWLLVGVTVLAFTSVGLNFFDEAFTPAVNRLWPPRAAPPDRHLASAPGLSAIAFEAATSDAAAVAARQFRGLTPAKVAYDPGRNLYTVMLTRSGTEEYRNLGPVYLDIDAASGRMIYADDPYADSFGHKLSRSLFTLHSGQIAGPAGVAMILVLGLATTEMCLTGAWLWWKRRPARVAARRAEA